MVFVTALLGISVSMIMKYFDNIVKCFGGSLILYSTTLASMFFFGSRVDADFVLGLLVYSVSSFFYAGDPYPCPLKGCASFHNNSNTY